MQKDLIGCFHGFLFLDKNALGSTNPAEFYNVFQNFVPTTGSIGLKLVEKTKKAA